MQKENEKISGIMADDDTTNSNINSMIEKLKYDVITHSSETLELGFSSTFLLQPSSHNVKEVDQDIDGEITELENLIKKLQAEIIEMTQSVNKPLPVSYRPLISSEEDSCCNYVASHASPEILNELKESKRDAGLTETANDEGLLEEIKMLAESLSNLMNSPDVTNVQKEALNDVKWNFPALWENVTNSSNNNLEIAEKAIEDISRKLSKAFDYCIMHSSLDTDKPIYKSNSMIESTMESSVASSCVKAEISHCDKVPEFLGPNGKGTSNDTHEDDKKTSSSMEHCKDSTGYDELYGITNENGANDNTLSISPIILNTDTEETLKAPSDIPDTQTQSDTCEAMPLSESIIKNINRKISTIVGRDSEKSISKDRHNTDMSLMDKKLSIEFVKSFPRCKSEPKKCDDSYLINPINNVIVLTQGNVTNFSSTPGTPNGVRNNAKQTVSAFVSNIEKSGYTNKPEASQPLDSALTNVPFSKSDTLSKNDVQAHLTTTENILKPINTPDGPQLINTDNIIDYPDITKKNLKQSIGDLASVTSNGTGSMFSKLFDNTEEPQERIMTAEVHSGQGSKEEELSAVENEEKDEERAYEDDGDDTSTYDVD